MKANDCVTDYVKREGDYWVIYRRTDMWGEFPLYKTKDKKEINILLR